MSGLVLMLAAQCIVGSSPLRCYCCCCCCCRCRPPPPSPEKDRGRAGPGWLGSGGRRRRGREWAAQRRTEPPPPRPGPGGCAAPCRCLHRRSRSRSRSGHRAGEAGRGRAGGLGSLLGFIGPPAGLTSMARLPSSSGLRHRRQEMGRWPTLPGPQPEAWSRSLPPHRPTLPSPSFLTPPQPLPQPSSL